MGYLDADGYLFLCDRKRDMVISGGVNIYPAEIEAVLMRMPGVKDCAVFGIPDGEFGETLMAVVEPAARPQLDAADVQAHLETTSPATRCRAYRVRTRAAARGFGQIFKRRLRDPYWGRPGAAHLAPDRALRPDSR